MYKRQIMTEMAVYSQEFPAVAILGPRQVGKTTLAHPDRLVILDEVQRLPGLFAVLRGVIDQRRRAGASSGQFLLLGSASMELLAQSSESLAGCLATVEFVPLVLPDAEVPTPGFRWRVALSMCRCWS